jgi:hypothetical protein
MHFPEAFKARPLQCREHECRCYLSNAIHMILVYILKAKETGTIAVRMNEPRNRALTDNFSLQPL